MTCDPGAYSFRGAATFGACVTFVVAVVSDVAAGGRPLHTMTLGLVALAVAGLRLLLAGRHGGLFATIRGAVVAQPALHAATKLLPVPPDPDVSLVGHVTAESSTTALHVLVAAVIVAAVAGAERLFLAVATSHPFTRWLRLMWSGARPQPPAPFAEPHPAPPTRRPHLTPAPRRGPPVEPRASLV
ncbi:hypothetical protein [Pseudonocardia kunmingensis]|uniref:Uncharacterized protein n=1 Tax=Pseudonocardia kunmingensis TaxID=630975 RepID=A0A543DKL3_9PSEU|nr:hypothetical protein [Pseudonocardia kunmingensis]TQM09868.1 hypothetical protein FB558_5642 [Pseudonocardia kunmingensis]